MPDQPPSPDRATDAEAADATRIVQRAAPVTAGSGSGAGSADAAAPAPRAPPAKIEPGQVLGHTYEIEALLARGGMGEVYRARHTELGSLHAIKIILPELVSDPRIVAMFKEEAKKLRKVRNDAVVAYEGLFRDEFGRRYLVMEYVEGVPLAKLLKERPLSPAEVRRLRDRIASGLAAAHDKGIYHRDISPDNIILVAGRADHAKIIDFGIAKSADPGDRTVVGQDFAGKYSYVSPEQLGAYGGTVDGRSDIYSLGLVLVAAAQGRPLDMGNSPISVIEKRQGVPDLSGVPEELRDELRPLLQPDPAQRPQSMRELPGSAVAAPTVIEPAEARAAPPVAPVAAPSSQPPQTPPPAPQRRSAVPLVLAALVSFLLVVGAGAGYILLTRPAGGPALASREAPVPPAASPTPALAPAASVSASAPPPAAPAASA